MRYLCLVYEEEQALDQMPKGELDALIGEHQDFADGIRQSGHFVGGEALQPVRTATTLRMRQGRLVTTDGPFAETREQLGGYYLIDARDLNEAIQVASRIPSVRIGSVEVRPILDLGNT